MKVPALPQHSIKYWLHFYHGYFLNLPCITFKNIHTAFKSLAANAARFFKVVRPF